MKKKVKKMLITKDATLIYLYQRFGTARLREISREESTTLSEAGATDLVMYTHNDKATFYQSDSAGSIIRDYQEIEGTEIPPGFHFIGY